MIDDSDEEDEEDEASDGRRRGRIASGSLSAEEGGSEEEESGMASDLSGDDSHDMEGGCWAGRGRQALFMLGRAGGERAWLLVQVSTRAG